MLSSARGGGEERRGEEKIGIWRGALHGGDMASEVDKGRNKRGG